MSIATATKCDFCGKVTPGLPYGTFRYRTGEREMDCSGHGFNEIAIDVDFCEDCAKKAMRAKCEAEPEKWRTKA